MVIGNMVNHELPRQIDYDCRKCYLNNICKHYPDIRNVYEAVCSIENVPEHIKIKLECSLIREKDDVGVAYRRAEEVNERLMKYVKGGIDISSKQDSADHFAANGIDPVDISVYNEDEALKKTMENPEELEDTDKALKKTIARLKDLKDIDANDAKQILNEKYGVSGQSDFAKMLAKKHVADEMETVKKKVNKALEENTTKIEQFKNLGNSPAFDSLPGREFGDTIPTSPFEPGCKEGERVVKLKDSPAFTSVVGKLFNKKHNIDTVVVRSVGDTIPTSPFEPGCKEYGSATNCVGSIGSIESEPSGMSFFDLIDKHNKGTCKTGKEGE